MTKYNCNTTFYLDSGDLPGQFRYLPESVDINLAKKNCQEKGLILAPVKSKTTISALKKHFDDCSDSGHFIKLLFIGLEDEENGLVFTDNTRYNDTIHGSLFYSGFKPKTGLNCQETVLSIREEVLFAKPCEDQSKPLCYRIPEERATNTAAVSGGALAGIIIGALVVLICAVFFAFFFNKRRNLKKVVGSQKCVKTHSDSDHRQSWNMNPFPAGSQCPPRTQPEQVYSFADDDRIVEDSPPPVPASDPENEPVYAVIREVTT